VTLPRWNGFRLIVLFGIGSLVMRAAGCVVNDMWDRDIDRQVAPHGGAAAGLSGALGMRQATAFLALLLAMPGLAVLVQLNPLSMGAGRVLPRAGGPFTLWPSASHGGRSLSWGLPSALARPWAMRRPRGQLAWAQAALYGCHHSLAARL
jgi:4-hydroxybenzoate polyprenyltransferase